MRDIKCRAWEPVNEIMFYSNQQHDGNKSYALYFDEEGDFQAKVYIQYDSLVPLDSKEFEAIPMFFTGLKDKNNKEVYEGDILNVYNWGHSTKSELIGIGKVFWDDEECGWQITSIEENKYCIVEDRYDLFRKATFEIIGNIYENQSLIQ